MGERVHRSVMNAKVNILFYFLSLILAFFSRKIFLDNLGADFIGLTGTIGNILGYLNLAELGIGSCISIFLFKPIQNNDKIKINEIISIIGYLYKYIGIIILSAGSIISMFFPLIFRNESIELGIIYFSFYTYLCSSLIGYFINYRQILLSADQKNYVVSAYFQTFDIIKKGIQIYLAYNYKNLYVWIAVEFIFSLISCILLNWKINKEYPWLKSDKNEGKELLRLYPNILTNVKQIFIHKIKDFILNKSDELFVFMFVSLEMVAFYGNYIIIISKINQFFGRAQDGIGESVGNLVAENNRNKIVEIFWALMSIKYLIAGFVCFAIYNYTEPFISLWLGKQYLLPHNILVLLTLYIYITNTRGVVDMYNHAYGLYADTWSAWTELILNISITVLLGFKYGIIGILYGKLISTGLIIIFWKPFYLFTSGLKLPTSVYWYGTLKFQIMIVLSFILGEIICDLSPIDPNNCISSLIIYCITTMAPFILILISGFYFFTPGTKQVISRLKFWTL